jgi:acyl-CoA synthetase
LYELLIITLVQLREYKVEGMVFASLVLHWSEDGSNLLLFTSHDEFIYCLKDSRLHWRTKLSSKGVASPALFRRELVIVPSTSGVLYILKLSDGQIIAEFSLPNQTFSSPVIWDNRIVIGCRDDYVHCLEIDY